MSIMADRDSGDAGSHWHTALAFALTGQRWEGLDGPAVPDPDRLARQVSDRFDGGTDGLRAMITARRGSGKPWPFTVPDDLRAGLGAAQWLAALAAVRDRLGLDRRPSRVPTDQLPDADERRLLREVPPHHGH